MRYLINHVSVVVENLARIEPLYEALGLRAVVRGDHPVFGARYTLFATAKGGILLLERGEKAHEAVAAFAERRDRHFHLCFACEDLGQLLTLAAKSKYVTNTIGPYDGITRSRAVTLELKTGDDTTMFVEFSDGLHSVAAATESWVQYIESIALHAPTHASLLDPLADFGMHIDPGASNASFPQLGSGSINMALPLDWCWLEINAPSGQMGLGNKILERLGRPGVSGISLAVDDLKTVETAALAAGIPLNTKEPYRLDALIRGEVVPCADMYTVNRKASELVSLFMMKPLDYPHHFWTTKRPE